MNMTSDKRNKAIIGVLSLLIPVSVAVLLFSAEKMQGFGDWVSFLPHLNAVINSSTAILLILGVYFVKNKKVDLHKMCMKSAFLLGTLFLVSYIVYHSSTESTHFGGVGMVRYIYFTLLLSHIFLAAIVVPFVLLAIYYALTERIESHKKIVKYTFPIWLYVSVTGVIVYLMISPYYIQ